MLDNIAWNRTAGKITNSTTVLHPRAEVGYTLLHFPDRVFVIVRQRDKNNLAHTNTTEVAELQKGKEKQHTEITGNCVKVKNR